MPCLRCRTSSPCLLLVFRPAAQPVLALCQGDRQSPAGHLLSAQAHCVSSIRGLCKQEQTLLPWGIKNYCYLLVYFDSNKFNLRCNKATVNSRAKWSSLSKETVKRLLSFLDGGCWLGKTWCICIPILSLIGGILHFVYMGRDGYIDFN